MERDPNGKNPHEPGAKLDVGKSPVFRGLIDYFPRACMAVAEVSDAGAKKYAWKSWQHVPNAMERYSDALGRHLFYEAMGESHDKDTKLLHKAHAAWNALAVLEMCLREKENESKRVSDESTSNKVAYRGCDVCSTEPIGRSRGVAVGHCQSQTQTGRPGSNDDPQGSR